MHVGFSGVRASRSSGSGHSGGRRLRAPWSDAVAGGWLAAVGGAVAVGDDGDGDLRHDRGGHLRHRIGGGFLFLDEPLRPLLEHPVDQRDGGGAHPAGDHVCEEALDVLARELLRGARPAGGRQVAQQVVRRAPIDLDRCW